MFQVHPLAVLALVSVLLCWALGVVLFRTAMLALYPVFLAIALRTPLVRPFGRPAAQAGLAVVAATLWALANFAPARFGEAVLYLAMASVFLFALAASIHAWYVSTGSGRTRAFIFALAFGFRDVCWTFVYSAALLPIWFPDAVSEQTWDQPFWDLHALVYMSGTLVAVPLIAYGILRTQLFDIDLRIRWTIKQTTVAAAILSVVFLVSEGASIFLSAELGNVAGLLAAAVVMFFLAPLQRFAERFAAAAMPNTENTPEYAAFRKMQVFEEAVAEAREGGGISSKERALLNRLRESLGICESDAATIERELEAGLRG